MRKMEFQYVRLKSVINIEYEVNEIWEYKDERAINIEYE